MANSNAGRQGDFVQLNNQVLRADYLRVPDESAHEEDVAIEATVDGRTLMVTMGQVRDSHRLPDGTYLVPGVGALRFFAGATIH